MINFTESNECKAEVHCKTCRNLVDGRSWRTGLRSLFKIDGVDFSCPLNHSWGHQGKGDNEIYYNPLNDKLGDNWAFVNWAYHKTIKIYADPKILEIIPLLNGEPKFTLIEERGTKTPDTQIFNIKYFPTKIRWIPNKSNLIVYQLDSISFKHYVTEEEILPILKSRFKDYEFIRLNKEKSLSECIDMASISSCYIGTSSGMSHVMHSVGVPMFLYSPKPLDISRFHMRNIYSVSDSINNLLENINNYITNNVYNTVEYDPSCCGKKDYSKQKTYYK